jgi:hypothetical protein
LLSFRSVSEAECQEVSNPELNFRKLGSVSCAKFSGSFISVSGAKFQEVLDLYSEPNFRISDPYPEPNFGPSDLYPEPNFRPSDPYPERNFRKFGSPASLSKVNMMLFVNAILAMFF